MKTTITVCASCLRASCWWGIFYCDNYLHADVAEKTREELQQLDREHPSYWDYESKQEVPDGR